MPSSFFTFLDQPFPTYKQHKKQILVCTIATVSVFLMLYVLEPFNINLLTPHERLVYAFLYSGITFMVCILFTIIAPLIFPLFFHEAGWTISKEISYVTFILIFISAVNWVVHHLLDYVPLTFGSFFLSLSYTLPLAAFPVSFSILIKQKWLKQQYSRQADCLNALLDDYKKKNLQIEAVPVQEPVYPELPDIETYKVVKEEELISTSAIVVLSGTGVGEVIELEEEELIAVSAADNYVTVYYQSEGRVATCLLRSTLKSIEEKTRHSASIVRCHRSYVINLKNIQRIVGDAQGLKLLMKGMSNPILVGKSYLEKIKMLIDVEGKS